MSTPTRGCLFRTAVQNYCPNRKKIVHVTYTIYTKKNAMGCQQTSLDSMTMTACRMR